MKKIILLVALTSSIFASSSDGIILGTGVGSTSTKSTTSSTGAYRKNTTGNESGSTFEISLEYRIKSIYQIGITYGDIAVADSNRDINNDSSVYYLIATADYIFMKDKKWRPFIGIALGNSTMDYKLSSVNYKTSSISLKNSALALGIRAGVAYEFGNLEVSYRIQYLSTKLEASDSLYVGTEYETKMVAGHEDFMNSMIFVKYHF